MSSSRPSDGFIEKMLDVLVLVLERPRTLSEMLEITEYKPDTIRKYMKMAVEYGLVYIMRYDTHPIPGRKPRAVFAMQPKPFEVPNAERPW